MAKVNGYSMTRAATGSLAASPLRTVTPTRLIGFVAHATRALWTQYAPRQALRFVLRWLLRPRVSFGWCRFLAGTLPDPDNYGFAAGLLEKPQRPYINMRWGCRQRMVALTNHYRIIRCLPLSGLLTEAHVYPQTLATFEAAGAGYRLVLHGGGHSREGELELELRAEDGRRVVMIAFSFIRSEPALTVAIGCLQGGPALAHRDIASVSRAFYGIPVKLLITRLMRHLVGCVAVERGVAHLVAVDDSAQVFQHHHYRAKRKVTASYGATWEALGGEPRDDGFWELPVCEVPPDYAAMKSSKRSAARHRWEALGRTYAAIDASLAGFGTLGNARKVDTCQGMPSADAHSGESQGRVTRSRRGTT